MYVYFKYAYMNILGDSHQSRTMCIFQHQDVTQSGPNAGIDNET